MAAASRAALHLSLSRLAIGAVLILLIAACGNGDDGEASPSPTATGVATATPSPVLTATSTPTPTVAPSPSPTPEPAPALEPAGLPIAGDTRTGVVRGTLGSRTIAWGEGPAVEAYSRDDQVSSDPERANRAGWNCRVHVEYEGQPAVDWYVPEGTPLIATMDGTATLYLNTITNAFDFYGVEREPYLGNPDRSRASVSPFPGPGGGMGAFVRIENGEFRVDYGHLSLEPSLALVPGDAYLGGFSAGYDFAGVYAVPRDFRTADAVARWDVRRGDVIGYSGDAGYSEAPHLHYVVRRQGGAALCPTAETGFNDGGWLWR